MSINSQVRIVGAVNVRRFRLAAASLRLTPAQAARHMILLPLGWSHEEIARLNERSLERRHEALATYERTEPDPKPATARQALAPASNPNQMVIRIRFGPDRAQVRAQALAFLEAASESATAVPANPLATGRPWKKIGGGIRWMRLMELGLEMVERGSTP